MKIIKKIKDKLDLNKNEDDYETYIFTKNEWIMFFMESEGIIALTAFLFYKSFIAFIILQIALIFLYKRKKSLKKEQRINNLTIQFKDAINSMSASLNAGYSPENSLIQALKETLLIYGKDEIICLELMNMKKALKVNERIEDLFLDLGRRSNVEDIKIFAEVFSKVKRNGGNLNAVIKDTADTISQKVQIKRDIYTLMSQKRFEQKIMNGIPFFIIFYINISSPGFLDILYGNILGIAVMSICLLIYCIAFIMAEKIIRIEV
ncbi:tight adherence protein B [Acetitomaculum ruminis DSM 5522]|uniref:Tight adherence protein B n=1 Tax=Acetitomaculum ruminis DSM 5522 TaxID=1120918 RepID=A0A1I0Y7Z5_9FIRM|nr:type II secretion system F family protein [Acetitomaculum ruminis]SFB09525.1 tight adherence protein B [Acetitomaculum ruminis DSM 5522]